MDRFENLYKPIKKSLATCLLGTAMLLYGHSAASAQISLGNAADFTVLGGAAVTCTNSDVNGDVGVVAPGPFTDTLCNVVGTVFPDAPLAYEDFLAAYVDLAAVPCDFFLGSTLTPMVLAPGVYCTVAALTATGVALTLDDATYPTGTWIFKIGTGGTGALTGTGFTVDMASGETCSNNVSWWTAQAATMTDSVFLGSILAGTDITLTRGSMDGQALAGGTGSTGSPAGAVTLTDTVISFCGLTPTPPTTGLSKVITNGDIVVETLQEFTTPYQFELTYTPGLDDPENVVIFDNVPAEWAVTDIDNLSEVELPVGCGESEIDLGIDTNVDVSKGGKSGKKCQSSTEIAWNLTPSALTQTITVDITTVASPSNGKGKQRADKFKPTSCGPLFLNDGAVAFAADEDGNLILDINGDPIPVGDPSNSLVIAAVEDLDGTLGVVGNGTGDEDQDGLSDGDEVFAYGTNPCLTDTDGGGESDGSEVSNGRNPLDPGDDIS